MLHDTRKKITLLNRTILNSPTGVATLQLQLVNLEGEAVGQPWYTVTLTGAKRADELISPWPDGVVGIDGTANALITWARCADTDTDGSATKADLAGNSAHGYPVAAGAPLVLGRA